MRRNYLALIAFAIAVSCSEDDLPCRLITYTQHLSNGAREHTYTYEASGNLHTRMRTFEFGDTDVDTYSYNQDGNVSRIDQDVYNAYRDSTYHHYLLFAYTDGMLSSITEHAEDGDLISTDTYEWDGESFVSRYTPASKPNPSKIEEYTYLNGNITTRKISFYTGNEPNVASDWHEAIFEDFDTALTPFYVTKSARPGMVLQISRNNHRKETSTTHHYFDGVWTEESHVVELQYAYNASGGTVGIRRIAGGSATDTVIIYDGCKN